MKPRYGCRVKDETEDLTQKLKTMTSCMVNGFSCWTYVICFTFLLLTFALCARKSVTTQTDGEIADYSGHKVIRLFVSTEDQLAAIRDLEANPSFEVDVWTTEGGSTEDNTTSMDVRVAPDVFDDVVGLLTSVNVTYAVLIEDVQSLVDEQLADLENHRQKRRRKRHQSNARQAGRPSNSRPCSSLGDTQLNSTDTTEEDRSQLWNIIDTYATHCEITKWLSRVERVKRDIVQVIEIGRSYMGRPIRVARIGALSVNGTAEGRTEEKPAIWLDGGIHAREWISTATAVYIIYTLASGYGHDAAVTRLVEDFDWYILPVVNPDGYEFSHTHNRFWRKTRSRIIPPSKRNCVGVDANRNFDFNWRRCPNDTTLATCLHRNRNPCDEVFPGRKAFSEPETIALANFIVARRHRIKLYLSLHSYSQLWLVPWGYTVDLPFDIDALIAVSRIAVNSLEKIHNTKYKIGSPAKILYSAAGGSYDWAKGVVGIKYSFTIELRDTGKRGFLLPANEIVPTGEETWAGLSKLVSEVKKDTCWMNGTGCDVQWRSHASLRTLNSSTSNPSTPNPSITTTTLENP